MENVLKKPLISVIMSVYNEPIEWISQSINSILNQTLNNFEFIIVNDNPIRSENISLLKSFVANDRRIKIIYNQTNLGLPASLNKAIDQAQGKYIARMDADDISLSNRFQLQYDFLEKNPEYGICGTYAHKLDKNSKIGKKIRLDQTNEELKARLLFYSPFVHPSVMVRTDLIYRLKYNENFRVAQDVELWLRMSKETKFYNIPKTLLYYRVHGCNSRKRERTDTQNDIYKTLANIRLHNFISAEGNETVKNLFVIFSSFTKTKQISSKEINSLFYYLLNNLGNNNALYNVLLQRYIYEVYKEGLILNFFYNPFVRFSFIKYLLHLTNLTYKVLF